MSTSTVTPAPRLDDPEAQVAFFRANSYVALPDLLTGEQVAALNEAMDRDRERNRFMWFCEGHPDYNCNLLLIEPLFEITVRQPTVLALMGRFTFEHAVTCSQSDHYKERELRRGMWRHMVGASSG